MCCQIVLIYLQRDIEKDIFRFYPETSKTPLNTIFLGFVLRPEAFDSTYQRKTRA